MRTLSVDRLLGCLEEMLQLGTWSPPDEFQHDGKAARRSRIIHGLQIRYETFLIDAPRVDGFLPGLEHHFGAATVERLVETV
jgi:hypothetical protein